MSYTEVQIISETEQHLFQATEPHIHCTSTLLSLFSSPFEPPKKLEILLPISGEKRIQFAQILFAVTSLK